ncbi:DUF3791 domain-containing protein [Prevotella sp. PMUR]|uniref:DUF3791 domain-containing protein n=2 Tax=Xylanibacter muris TaxID=2736290 RepID=A0ABX2ANK7_9BACT|nr:DUF3791 domain-containing protein [Xylanibacter muris]
MSDNGYSYPSDIELRNIFASSCVEAAAARIGCSVMEMYARMKNVDLLNKFIYPFYDSLHTQSREVVTSDVLEALNTREQSLKR